MSSYVKDTRTMNHYDAINTLYISIPIPLSDRPPKCSLLFSVYLSLVSDINSTNFVKKILKIL